MKINKKQITLAVLVAAFACCMQGADEAELIRQARDFAHQLAMCVNPQGSALLTRLAARVGGLWRFRSQVQAQAERIGLLEAQLNVLGAQVEQSKQVRLAILNTYGVQAPTDGPVAPLAPAPAAPSVQPSAPSTEVLPGSVVRGAPFGASSSLSAPSLSVRFRSIKRAECTGATSDQSEYASSPKRPRGGRPAKVEATYPCKICGTLYTSDRGLQIHESSITHRENAALQKSLAQPSAANASTATTLSDDDNNAQELIVLLPYGRLAPTNISAGVNSVSEPQALPFEEGMPGLSPISKALSDDAAVESGGE